MAKLDDDEVDDDDEKEDTNDDDDSGGEMEEALDAGEEDNGELVMAGDTEPLAEKL